MEKNNQLLDQYIFFQDYYKLKDTIFSNEALKYKTIVFLEKWITKNGIYKFIKIKAR